MANRKKNWTPQEEAVLSKCIKESKTLTDAFIKASKKLDRSLKGVSGHYYYNKKHVLTLYRNDIKQAPKSTFSKFISWTKQLFNI